MTDKPIFERYCDLILSANYRVEQYPETKESLTDYVFMPYKEFLEFVTDERCLKILELIPSHADITNRGMMARALGRTIVTDAVWLLRTRYKDMRFVSIEEWDKFLEDTDKHQCVDKELLDILEEKLS